jgi:hypothetical protein
MKFLIPFFIIASVAFAQAPERTFRVLYLKAPSSAPRELVLFDGEESQEVKLPRMNFSPVYELRAGVKAVALLNKAPERVEEVPREAPRVRIPEEVTDFYLFISTDANNPISPVRMTVVDAASKDFGIGQMLWFNLTDNTIGGKIGGERIVIKPKDRYLMDAPVEDASNYPVKLAYRMDGNPRVYPICETRWFHDPNSRNVAFVFPRPGVRTPRVMVFPDHRTSWKKPEEETAN